MEPRRTESRHQARDLPGDRIRRYGQLLLVALLLFPPPLFADTITLGGSCTLEEAINEYQGDPSVCVLDVTDPNPGTNTIVLTSDVTLTAAQITPGGGNADNGLPKITSDIRIDGDGYTIDRLSGDEFRFFEVASSGTLTLIDATLTNGDVGSGNGGAILSYGQLILWNSTVTANFADEVDGVNYQYGSGGGIFVDSGTTTLYNSTVSHNDAFAGGGVYTYGKNSLATAALYNSTVSNNFAASSGGGMGGLYYGDLVNTGGSVVMVNSTVSQNMANGDGGGIFAYSGKATVTLINSTMSGNIADFNKTTGGYGNAIYSGAGTGGLLTIDWGVKKKWSEEKNLSQAGYIILANTIIAHHPGPMDGYATQSCDGTGTPPSGLGNLEDDSSCINGIGSGINGWVDENLTDQGGPTETHQLLCVPGNDAINGAGNCVADYDLVGDPPVDLLPGVDLNFDQRGLPRVDSDPMMSPPRCDVGSYEFQDTGGDPGGLHPIALHLESLKDDHGVFLPLPVALLDIYNGTEPGNFGWLTWTGDPSVPALAASLTVAGDSHLWFNPDDPSDSEMDVGEWIQGSPGVSNARDIRDLLNDLINEGGDPVTITVPIWDDVRNGGNNSDYRVWGFAKMQITDYQLPRDNVIGATVLEVFDSGCPYF